jgi:purine-binding chemotaxis protein CheW
MNLRGEIVTLVDIRNILNLPTNPVSLGSQTVVVQVDDIVAGLPVDQVWEMVYLNEAEMTPLSGVFSELGEQYLRGTAFFQEKILKVLDLAKIFTQGELVVNEQA